MGSLENPEKRITNPEQPKPYKPLSRGDFLAKFGELPKTPIETNEKSAKIFSELTQAYLHTAVSGDEQRHRLLTTSVIIDNLKTAVLKRKPDKLVSRFMQTELDTFRSKLPNEILNQLTTPEQFEHLLEKYRASQSKPLTERQQSATSPKSSS